MGEGIFHVQLNTPTEGARKGLHIQVLKEGAEN